MTMPAGAKALREQLLQQIIDMLWLKMQNLADENWEANFTALQVQHEWYNQMTSYQELLTESEAQV